MARSESVEPRERSILREPPDRVTLWQATCYVLRVRTNLVLIVASALGYFFFSGLRGFAIEFAKQHYGLPQALATSLTLVLGIGALAGVLTGGRLADRLLRGGRVAARVEVAGIAVLCTGVVFVPAFITTSALIAVPLLLVGALFLGMANPPLDAARLDVIHPALWGRAEGIRSVLRGLGDGGAPVLVGVLAQDVFGGGTGLEYTMLVLLTALFAGAIVTLAIARRTYPPDVAAVARTLDRS
jgi:sugar phosphate permease